MVKIFNEIKKMHEYSVTFEPDLFLAMTINPTRGISSNMRGNIPLIGHFSALGKNCSKENKIQILTNLKCLEFFKKSDFWLYNFRLWSEVKNFGPFHV